MRWRMNQWSGRSFTVSTEAMLDSDGNEGGDSSGGTRISDVD